MAEKENKKSHVLPICTVIIACALAMSVAAGASLYASSLGNRSGDPSESLPDDDGGNDQQQDKFADVQTVEKTGSYGLIEEFTIVYEDGTKSTFIVVNGENGPDAFQAFPNEGGNTPSVRLGENGNWIINDKDTGLVADVNRGLTDVEPHVGDNGHWYIGDVDTGAVAQGEPGLTPFIGENGNWWIGETDTGVNAGGGSGGGQAGENGKSAYEIAVELGYQGTPEEWLLSLVGPAGKSAWDLMQESGYTGSYEEFIAGLAGQPGKSAYEVYCENHEDPDLSVEEWLDSLKGADGNGKSAYEIYCDLNAGDDLSEAEWLESLVGAAGDAGRGIVSIDGPVTDGLYDTYTIHYTEGSDTTFVVKNGEDGDDGSVTLFGDGEPDALQGRNGDAYLDTQDFNYYVKENDAWVLKGNLKGDEGAQGLAGEAGKSLYAANGVPEAELGAAGDSYVNTANGDLYVKGSEGWGDPIGNLKGAEGNGIVSIAVSDDSDPTKTVYTVTYDNGDDTFEIAKPRSIVSIVRTNGNGEAGSVDTYTITYNYGDADTFTVTNGADGNTIYHGEGEPDNALGSQDDVYIDTENSVLYVKGLTEWSNGVSFKGEDGRGIANITKTGPAEDGLTYTYTITYTDSSEPFVFTVTNGADGADGAKVVTGSTLPTVLTGFNEDDAFINTSNWNYYVLQDDGSGGLEWDYRGNIRGTGLYVDHIGDDEPTVLETYKAGDSFLNLDTWDYYVLQDNAGTLEWHLEGNIRSTAAEHTVTFESNGGSAVAEIDDALEGHPIVQPTAPTKANYYFQGWYTAEGNKWDFEKDVVSADITLYAHWAQFQVTNGVLTGCTATGDVAIPEYFDGQYIIGIGSGVFMNNTAITAITLPSTVRTIDAMAFSGCTNLVSVDLNNVKTIGYRAFYNCTSLRSVVIPEDAQTITSFAFEECSSLSYLYFPENCAAEVQVSAFKNCVGLKDAVIPNGVTITGSGLFTGCTNLESLTTGRLNSSVGALYGVAGTLKTFVYTGEAAPTNAAFGNCTNLENLIIASNPASLAKALFAGCTNLKYLEVPYIGQNATGAENRSLAYMFSSTSASSAIPATLKTVKFRSGNVYENAFKDCANLENIILPDDLTEIADIAFYGCTNLKDINLPSTLTSVGSYAFRNCASLERVTLPNSVLSLGSEAFAGCTSLTYAKLGNGITQLPNYVFDGCTNLVTVSLGDNLTSIGGYAFNNCYALVNIRIPSSVASIGDSAFCNCKSLVSVDLQSNSSLTEIKPYAFQYCTSLTNVKLPTACATIGESAFQYCSALESINLEDVSVIDTYAFDKCSSLVYLDLSSLVDATYSFNDCTSLMYVKFDALETMVASFRGCVSLKSIVLPNSCTSLESMPFLNAKVESITAPSLYGLKLEEWFGNNNLKNLKYVTLTNSGDIPNDAFKDITSLVSVNIKSNQASMTIGSQAFFGCTNLQALNLPNNVTSMGASAFQLCASLTRVQLPSELKIIPDNCFAFCSLLQQVNLANVTEVGTGAFQCCELLDGIRFGAIETIKSQAFFGCYSLKSIEIPPSIKNIGTNAFSNCLALESLYIHDGNNGLALGGFTGCDHLSYVYIGNGTKSIEYYAFSGCISLKQVVVPESVRNIYSDAFAGTNLESISLPSIGENGLLDMFGTEVPGTLKTVVITTAFKPILTGAFSGCSHIETIVFESDNITIQKGAFLGCDSLKTLIVPHLGEDVYDGSFSIGDEDPDGLLWSTSIGKISDNPNVHIVSWGEEDAWCAIHEYHEAQPGHVYVNLQDTPQALILNQAGDDWEPYTGPIDINIPNLKGDGYWYLGDTVTIYPCNSSGTFVNYTMYSEDFTDYLPTDNDYVYIDEDTLDVYVPITMGNDGDTYLNSSTGQLFKRINGAWYSNGYYPELAVANVTSGDSDPADADGADGDYYINSSTGAMFKKVSGSWAGEGYLFGNDGALAYWFKDSSDNSHVPTTLKRVEVTNDNQNIENYAFDGINVEEVIFNSALSVGNYAFNDCTSLKRVSLGNVLSSIGAGAFYNCTALESIELPDSLEHIKGTAFYNCTSLKSIKLPSALIELGAGAFRRCSSLESAIIRGSNIAAIQNYTFSGCTNLKDVRIEIVGITEIGQYAFENDVNLINVYMPSSVTTINKSAFASCYSLENIDLQNVQYIYSGAFMSCKSLRSINLYRTKSIGTRAFQDCSNLTNITINISVLVEDTATSQTGTSVANFAFDGCKSVSTIVVWGASGSTQEARLSSYNTWRSTYIDGNANDFLFNSSGNGIIFR